MSLPDFEVELTPERSNRRLVFGSGSLAMMTGLILILHLDLSVQWRGIISLVWIADCLRELTALARGMCRVRKLRLDSAGGLRSVSAEGRAERLTLRTGSMVFAGFAWLRVEFPDGSRHAELLTRASAQSEAWHGLQLIWQQCRDSFGHPVLP